MSEIPSEKNSRPKRKLKVLKKWIKFQDIQDKNGLEHTKSLLHYYDNPSLEIFYYVYLRKYKCP